MRLLVNYLSLKSDTPKRDFWDYGLLYDLLEDFEFQEVDTLAVQDLALVVIPARSHVDKVKEINRELNKVGSVVLFLMGDEEASFPINEIKHKNIKIWVQNPHPGLPAECRKLGTGYPFTIRKFLEENTNTPKKNLDWFFAGQVTHSRREECVKELRNIGGGELVESKAFTQGIEQTEYFKKMASAKVLPCPSGPETPDTFRLFEALELGGVPIADTQTPTKDWAGFWTWLFDEPVPFLEIANWESLNGYIEDAVSKYPALNNRIQAWWLRRKAKFKKQIYDDLLNLPNGRAFLKPITVVIPVSPIPSHPETHILEETLDSIRHHLPQAEIIITFDGVRKEQENRRADYEEHIRRILWKVRKWGNITPYIFDNHMHQSGMARYLLENDLIDTPLLLYVEQDTPLVTDEPIEWDHLVNKLIVGDSNLIRFHFEGVIPKEHFHLIIGEPEDKLLATAQWSQRPHLASVPFYRRILADYFSANTNCFIEDLVHGRLYEDFVKHGALGWLQWKVHIYYPNSKNIKRSYTTDGRAGSEKYDDTQIW